MSAELAKAMLEENGHSLSEAPNPEKQSTSSPLNRDGEQPMTFEDIPSMSVAVQQKNEGDEQDHRDDNNNDHEKLMKQQDELEDGSGDDLFF